MEYSSNSYSFRNGADPRRQRCRRCGACQQPESTTSRSDNLQRVLQRHQAALTGYGGGPSLYDPPPPYSGPAPSFDAPPPPYYGPQLPYYEPPPPYSETEPAPRLQPTPVQYEASRPCQLGTRLREDIFYINVLACQQPESTNSSGNLRVLQEHQAARTGYRGGPSLYDPPPPYSGPAPSFNAPPPPYYGPQLPYYEPPPPYSETEPAPRLQPTPVQYEASQPCQLGTTLQNDTLYGSRMPYYEPPPPYHEKEPAPRLQPVPVQYEASRPCQLGPTLQKATFYVNLEMNQR
ncbi:hypothetical protein SFRURICE_013518 [Spodoptera frugiperda]|nr:hypothetical protein SFRURICE_013518 [Spodoptera frugiperda]